MHAQKLATPLCCSCIDVCAQFPLMLHIEWAEQIAVSQINYYIAFSLMFYTYNSCTQLFQTNSHKFFDIYMPLSVYVCTFMAWLLIREVRFWLTDIPYTGRHQYCNPCCTGVPRIKNVPVPKLPGDALLSLIYVYTLIVCVSLCICTPSLSPWNSQ